MEKSQHKNSKQALAIVRPESVAIAASIPAGSTHGAQWCIIIMSLHRLGALAAAGPKCAHVNSWQESGKVWCST